jgi:protoheme IX farnesyltransferase
LERPRRDGLAEGRGFARTLRDYLALTKPKVLSLLVATALASMVLAERGVPHPFLLFGTLVGGAGLAGAANVYNCVLDRVLDARMRRTRARPIPAGRVGSGQASLFGAALGLLSFGLLAKVGLAPALIALAGGVFYVLVYTALLKPRTPLNIVIGGAAGGAPALVGWAAVRGRLELPALLLFALVLLWTPPHFWALAIRFREDYATAGVPMLPAVKGVRTAARQIAAYSGLLVLTSLALGHAARLGPLYFAGAAALGILLMRKSLDLLLHTEERRAMGLFVFSNLYLFGLFALAALGAVLSPG